MRSLATLALAAQASGYVVQPARAPTHAASVSRSAAAPCMVDFPKPNLEDTDNYRAGQALSQKFSASAWQGEKKSVAIIGGGLSGLACAKYLSDAGHTPLVLEGRDVRFGCRCFMGHADEIALRLCLVCAELTFPAPSPPSHERRVLRFGVDAWGTQLNFSICVWGGSV